MKIFDRDRKINFVDDNNVLVGFDSQQSCCESFGWALSRSYSDGDIFLDVNDHPFSGENGIDPTGYQFDKDFYKTDVSGIYVFDGGSVVFRLVKNDDEIFLLLWNSHNGYYGHGFSMELDGQNIHSGCI